MKRIEIIFCQSIDDDFMNICIEKKIATHFTKIPNVFGKGESIPKMGDPVWPQLNTIYIIYCTNEDCEQIKSIIYDLRIQYPTEGIACFISNEEYTEV